MSGLLRGVRDAGGAVAAASTSLGSTGALAGQTTTSSDDGGFGAAPDRWSLSGALGARFLPWVRSPSTLLGAQDGYFLGIKKIPDLLMAPLEARLGWGTGYNAGSTAVAALDALPFGIGKSLRPNLQLVRQARGGQRAVADAWRPGEQEGIFERTGGARLGLNFYCSLDALGLPLATNFYAAQEDRTIDDGSLQHVNGAHLAGGPTQSVAQRFGAWLGLTGGQRAQLDCHKLAAEGGRKWSNRGIQIAGLNFDAMVPGVQLRARAVRTQTSELEVQRRRAVAARLPNHHELQLRHRDESEWRLIAGAPALPSPISLLRLFLPTLRLSWLKERKCEAKFSLPFTPGDTLGIDQLRAPWRRAEAVAEELSSQPLNLDNVRGAYAEMRSCGGPDGTLGTLHALAAEARHTLRTRIGTLFTFLPFQPGLLPLVWLRNLGKGERIGVRAVLEPTYGSAARTRPARPDGDLQPSFDTLSWVEYDMHTDARMRARTDVDVLCDDPDHKAVRKLNLRTRLTFNPINECLFDAPDADVRRVLQQAQHAFGIKAALPDGKLPGERHIDFVVDVEPHHIEALRSGWARRPLDEAQAKGAGVHGASVTKLHAALEKAHDMASATEAVRAFVIEAKPASAAYYTSLAACRLTPDALALGFVYRLLGNAAEKTGRRPPRLTQNYRCIRHDDTLIRAEATLARYERFAVPVGPLDASDRKLQLAQAHEALASVVDELTQAAQLSDQREPLTRARGLLDRLRQLQRERAPLAARLATQASKKA